jgi:hypothetical protein
MKNYRSIKNTKEGAFNIVAEIIKYAPVWDSLKIKVILGSQKKNTYVSVD